MHGHQNLLHWLTALRRAATVFWEELRDQSVRDFPHFLDYLSSNGYEIYRENEDEGVPDTYFVMSGGRMVGVFGRENQCDASDAFLYEAIQKYRVGRTSRGPVRQALPPNVWDVTGVAVSERRRGNMVLLGTPVLMLVVVFLFDRC